MSIQSDAKIRELERRVAALENLVSVIQNEDRPPVVSGDPPLHKTGTLTLPEKRKSA